MTSEDTAALCTTSSNGRSLLSHQYVSSASYVTNVQKAYSTVPVYTLQSNQYPYYLYQTMQSGMLSYYFLKIMVLQYWTNFGAIYAAVDYNSHVLIYTVGGHGLYNNNLIHVTWNNDIINIWKRIYWIQCQSNRKVRRKEEISHAAFQYKFTCRCHSHQHTCNTIQT